MKRQAIIWGSITSAALAAVYFIFIHKYADGLTLTQKKPADDAKEPVKDDTTSTVKVDATKPGSFLPLRQEVGVFHVNSYVKTMQDALRDMFNEFAIKSDGKYGQITESALHRAGYSSPVSFANYMDILGGKRGK